MIHKYSWNPETPNLPDRNGLITSKPTTKWVWCHPWDIGTAIANTMIITGVVSGIAISLAMPSRANPLAPTLPSSPTNPTAVSPNPNVTPIPLSTATRMSPYDSYILGIGDLLRLDVTTVPEYNGEYQLGPDGRVTFPIIGSFPAQGLTLKQLTEIITKRYSRILKRPELTLGLVGPRPIRIAVAGEVNRPGSYSIPFVGSVVGVPGPGGTTPVRSLNLVTVSSVVQTAGGITQLANVRQVQVRRFSPPISQDLLAQEPQLSSSVTDSPTTYTVDLWAVLVNGDLQQDFILRDGDMVIVPKAEPINLAELTKLGKSSIAPAKIPIHVIGEVGTPGKIELPLNSPMNLALLAAGGFNIRANRNSVDFIRLNPDGTVSRRKIKVDLSKGMNEQTNPPLQENDVIFVDRSGLTRYADNFEAVLSPMDNFFNFINVLRFFNVINTNFRNQ